MTADPKPQDVVVAAIADLRAIGADPTLLELAGRLLWQLALEADPEPVLERLDRIVAAAAAAQLARNPELRRLVAAVQAWEPVWVRAA